MDSCFFCQPKVPEDRRLASCFGFGSHGCWVSGDGTELILPMLTANLICCRAGVTLPLHSAGVTWSPSPKKISTKNGDCFA